MHAKHHVHMLTNCILKVVFTFGKSLRHLKLCIGQCVLMCCYAQKEKERISIAKSNYNLSLGNLKCNQFQRYNENIDAQILVCVWNCCALAFSLSISFLLTECMCVCVRECAVFPIFFHTRCLVGQHFTQFGILHAQTLYHLFPVAKIRSHLTTWTTSELAVQK